MKSTKEVIEHHLQAIGEGIDSVLSDFDDNSCIIGQQGTYRGIDEIKAFFIAFINGLPEGFKDAFKVTKMVAEGEVGYIIVEANPWIPFGTDTFVIKDGKIKYQTFSAYMPGS
jgi:hypothetical protein